MGRQGYDNSNNIAYEINKGKGLIKEYDAYNDDNLKFVGEYLNG